MDVGHQPLCDSLLSKAELNEPEVTYPLRLFRCPRCTLTQLDYVVEGSVVYAPDYPYRSGITKELEVYQRVFADGVIEKLGLAEGSLCVDIGSNDGTLLTGFKHRGMRALGRRADQHRQDRAQRERHRNPAGFFTEAVAKEIAKDYGSAKVITTTNVFAHMAPLGEVMRGILHLLAPDGVFITESHYLLDVLEKAQYDTIYHEHIRTYSLKSLVTLFEAYEHARCSTFSAPTVMAATSAPMSPAAVRAMSAARWPICCGWRKPKAWVDPEIYRNFARNASPDP